MSDDQEAGRDKLEIDNMFLCGSQFTRVSLKDALFRDSHLIGAVLDDVNASELKVGNVNLSGATFTNVTMTGAKISNANLQGLAIQDANLMDATINGVLVTDLFAAYEAQKDDGEA